MKYVFDRLFALAGTSVEAELTLHKAERLARHGWDDKGYFDLFADKAQSSDRIGHFFDQTEGF